jgi:hypothetical protein
MGDFKEHGVLLYLNPQELLGFIKCQADKGLGRSYAGKLCFIEGMYRLGYLNQADYESGVQKYSQGLNTVTPSAEQLAAQELTRKLETTLEGALKEWDTLPEKARAFHLKTAIEHKDLAIAVRVIQKGMVS